MNNQQTFNRLAPAFFFLQDPAIIAGSSVPYSWVDLGTIETRSSKVDIKEETIMDDRNGISQPITVVQNAFGMTYELETPNSSFRILQMYYRSTPAAAPSPAMNAGTGTSVVHTLYSGSPVKITDASGNGLVNITAITSVTVTAGSQVLAFGVDYTYTPQDLARGFIYMLPGSTYVTGASGVPATISYTYSATTGNVQLTPGSGPCVIVGSGEIHFASCEGSRMIRERGRYSIAIPEITLSAEKLARVKPVVTRLYDPTLSYPNDVTGYVGFPTP